MKRSFRAFPWIGSSAGAARRALLRPSVDSRRIFVFWSKCRGKAICCVRRRHSTSSGFTRNAHPFRAPLDKDSARRLESIWLECVGSAAAGYLPLGALSAVPILELLILPGGGGGGGGGVEGFFVFVLGSGRDPQRSTYRQPEDTVLSHRRPRNPVPPMSLGPE